jgi:hypothetical protein
MANAAALQRVAGNVPCTITTIPVLREYLSTDEYRVFGAFNAEQLIASELFRFGFYDHPEPVLDWIGTGLALDAPVRMQRAAYLSLHLHVSEIAQRAGIKSCRALVLAKQTALVTILKTADIWSLEAQGVDTITGGTGHYVVSGEIGPAQRGALLKAIAEL